MTTNKEASQRKKRFTRKKFSLVWEPRLRVNVADTDTTEKDPDSRTCRRITNDVYIK